MVTDGIVKIHVHISFHRGWTRIFRWTRVSSHWMSPLGLRCPNWMWPCTCCFLPQLGLPVKLEEKGGPSRGHLTEGSPLIGRLSLGCWHCLHVPLDPDRLSLAARWVTVLFVCLLAVFVSWTRGVYPTWTDAAMTLQLYVTVVRCPRLDGSRRRGWRNLSVVTEEGLAWLVIR